MTDSAKLDLLLSEMQEMKQDIHLLKDDAEKLKEEIREIYPVLNSFSHSFTANKKYRKLHLSQFPASFRVGLFKTVTSS